MGKMINVTIDSDDMIEMLCDRLQEWTNTFSPEYELFSQYYEEAVENGYYDDSEFNPALIVDNDWVNYMLVITEDDFDNYNIEDEDDERIILSDGEGHYLISNT